MEAVDSWEIFYKRSLDAGKTWSENIRLTNDPGTSEVPIVPTSGDVVHLVWTDNGFENDADSVDDYELYYMSSLNAGQTWSSPIRLTKAPKSSLDMSMAVHDSDVHIFWRDRRDSKLNDPRSPDSEMYYKYSSDGGLTWSGDERITRKKDFSLLPSVTATGSVVHVMWTYRVNDNNSKVCYSRKILK